MKIGDSVERPSKEEEDCAIMSSVRSLVLSEVITDYQHWSIYFLLPYCHIVTSSFVSWQKLPINHQKQKTEEKIINHTRSSIYIYFSNHFYDHIFMI